MTSKRIATGGRMNTSLPTELLESILLNLPLPHLLPVQQVCSKWRAIIQKHISAQTALFFVSRQPGVSFNLIFLSSPFHLHKEINLGLGSPSDFEEHFKGNASTHAEITPDNPIIAELYGRRFTNRTLPSISEDFNPKIFDRSDFAHHVRDHLHDRSGIRCLGHHDDSNERMPTNVMDEWEKKLMTEPVAQRFHYLWCFVRPAKEGEQQTKGRRPGFREKWQLGDCSNNKGVSIADLVQVSLMHEGEIGGRMDWGSSYTAFFKKSDYPDD